MLLQGYALISLFPHLLFHPSIYFLYVFFSFSAVVVHFEFLTIEQELQVPFLAISAPEVVSGMSGESESKIRSLFNDAMVYLYI